MALGKEPREEPTTALRFQMSETFPLCIRMCRIKYVTTHLSFSVQLIIILHYRRTQIREIDQLKAHMLYLHTKRAGLMIL